MPKSPEVRLSPKAQADIDAIFDYTDAQWGWRQAEDYVAELRIALASLAEPFSLASTAKSIRKNYFVLRCGSHNVFFRKKRDAILVIRILHQRMAPNATYVERSVRPSHLQFRPIRLKDPQPYFLKISTGFSSWRFPKT